MEDAGRLAMDRESSPGERDEELALAARSDPEAFGLLYNRHRLAVYRYLRSRTGTEDDAAELTAVAFEKALAAMPRYRPSGAGFLAWLMRIARNAAIDAGRRSWTVPFTEDVTDERRATAPEALVVAKERQSTLLAAINRLPQTQRDAIVLRYAARLTAREIGQVLGKSDQATQKLLTRALATIKEIYDVDN